MEDIQMGVIRAMKKRLMLLIIAVLAVAVFAGCGGRKTDTNGDVTGDVETLLHALLTCPNDKLYDSEGTYISLDDSEVGSTEEDLERDKNAWKEAIGGCFAEDRFDTFYGQWERTAFLGEAYIQGDSIELNDIKIEDGDDLVKTIKASITVSNNGGTASSEILTTWIITFDGNDKIQKVELKDDGGYL